MTCQCTPANEAVTLICQKRQTYAAGTDHCIFDPCDEAAVRRLLTNLEVGTPVLCLTGQKESSGEGGHLAEQVAAAMDVGNVFDLDHEHANGLGWLAAAWHDVKGHAVGVHYQIAQHLNSKVPHTAHSTCLCIFIGEGDSNALEQHAHACQKLSEGT